LKTHKHWQEPAGIQFFNLIITTSEPLRGIHQNYVTQPKTAESDGFQTSSGLALGSTISRRYHIMAKLIPDQILKMALLILLCVLSGTLTAQSSYSGLPFVRQYRPAEYKAGIQNWDIAQDKRGLIYIANNFGLLEFDGSQWQIFGVPNGTKVRSVAIDPSGKVYVGCQGDFGYFFPGDRGQLNYVSLADSLESKYRNFDETWSVYIDNQQVYFCTFSRIYIYHKEKGFTVVEPQHAIDLSFHVNRQLYVNERAVGLGLLQGNTIHQLPGGDFFIPMSISSILPLHGDELLVSTFQHGIYIWRGDNVRPWNESLHKQLQEANVNAMIRLRNGNFAIGTQNDGLLILNPNGELITHLTRGRGLENRTVLSLYEDDLNNLWVGQNNGIVYLELGSPFTFLNEQAGLPGTGYAAFLDGDDLYLGTNTGLYRKDNSKPGTFQLIENTRGQVYYIGRHGDDLLAGHHNGSLRVEGDRAIKLSNEPGSWVFTSLKSNPQRLIEGTYNGLQWYDKDESGHWKHKNKLKGFVESSRIMAEDETGDLWITHGYKGVYRIPLRDAPDSVSSMYYGTDKGFPSTRLINVFKIRNELVFTSEHGVFQYDRTTDSFVRDELFTPKLGGGVQLWAVQQDALGNIYFIGVDHLGMFQKNAAGEYILQNRDFSKIRKYLNDDLESITILKNNEVLFGAKDGFIHYDPARRREQPSSFKSLIRKVVAHHEHDSVLFFGNYVDGDSVTERQLETYKPELPYASNSLTFSFSATSFEGDTDLQYQYYLENYEKTWSDWNTNTLKEYTNLKEGKYVFHVRARDSNNIMSKEATYEFEISPPWYRSIVAYVIYAATVLALLFFGFSVLDRKYQREQQRMVAEQEKELNAKDNEIVELSQRSKEEISKLQNEKLESELQHKNNELATSTMHLLNKNEFISGIRSTLGHIIKKSSNDEVRKELVQITKDIEQNISADSDWEHFQFHFDRVHGDFTTRFKAAFPLLSPQEIKLSAYLRMNLSTKEIAQLLNISVRGVEISRYRLRKKLHLDRNQNLQDFILNF
jgi:hypothetical protein